MWLFIFFFFNDTATTEIYTLSLHDALPISRGGDGVGSRDRVAEHVVARHELRVLGVDRSEEHTSELQSPCNLVCRLLLEKKKTQYNPHTYPYTLVQHPPHHHVLYLLTYTIH